MQINVIKVFQLIYDSGGISILICIDCTLAILRPISAFHQIVLKYVFTNIIIISPKISILSPENNFLDNPISVPNHV